MLYVVFSLFVHPIESKCLILQYKDYEFKSFTLDVDSNNKSERPEWGEGKYQGDTGSCVIIHGHILYPLRKISA